mgnify:FL=1
MLESLAEIKISARHINRMADDVVSNRQEQQRAALHGKGQLKVEVSNLPDLAVVETDSGRIRTRETDCGSGTHNPSWQETKTALCIRMSNEVHEHESALEPPKSLQNRKYVSKLATEVASAKSYCIEAIWPYRRREETGLWQAVVNATGHDANA